MQGKIKKTDTAVKTVESWWALIFADGSAVQSAIKWVWPVIGGSIAAVIGYVTSWINAFGPAGWAIAGVMGILLTLAIMYGVEQVRIARIQRTSLANADTLVVSNVSDSGGSGPSISSEAINSMISHAIKNSGIEGLEKRVSDCDEEIERISYAANYAVFAPRLTERVKIINGLIAGIIPKLEQDPKHWKDIVRSFASEVNGQAGFTGLLKDDEQSPEYQKNPFRAIQGEELIAEMEGRQDYRAAMDRAKIISERLSVGMRLMGQNPLKEREFYSQLLQDTAIEKRP